MSYQRSRKQKVGAKARRIQDRELARIERARRVRRATLRHVMLRVGVVVAVLAVLAGAGLVVRAVVANNRRGPANMASDGIMISSTDGQTMTATRSAPLPDNGVPTPSADLASSGVTQVVAYLDYADPASAAFWATNGAGITQMLKASQGMFTLEIHPVAIPSARESFTPLPAATASPTASSTPSPTPSPTPQNLQDAGYDYALRAANTFACVANGAPDQALAVNDALFAAQATFGTSGLTDDQLVALVQKAGVTAKGTSQCIRSHHYERWVKQATARATTAVPFSGVPALGTAPLIVVGGHQYTGKVDDATAFTSIVLQAYQAASQAASAASGTPTPAPSDSATAGATVAPTSGGTPAPTAGS